MKRSLVAILVLASLVPWPAFGWQEDLHYGLSKWLAYKAGFSLEDAEAIARSAAAGRRSSVNRQCSH